MSWLNKYSKNWYLRYQRYLNVKHGIEEEKNMSSFINMNDMAAVVARREQGDQVNIAQIKEVLRIFLEELSSYEDEEILEVVKRYNK